MERRREKDKQRDDVVLAVARHSIPGLCARVSVVPVGVVVPVVSIGRGVELLQRVHCGVSRRPRVEHNDNDNDNDNDKEEKGGRRKENRRGVGRGRLWARSPRRRTRREEGGEERDAWRETEDGAENGVLALERENKTLEPRIKGKPRSDVHSLHRSERTIGSENRNDLSNSTRV